MEVHQSANIETGLLDDLHLANVHVLKRVESLALLLDVFSNGVRDQLGAE